MVYLQFPANFTEEEQMLQAKYAKLKRKKKQLAAAKAAASGSGDAKASGDTKKIVSGDSAGGSGTEGGKKRIPEAKDAKEVARRLVKTGAIAAIQKSVQEKEKEKSRGFKRSQGNEGERAPHVHT